MHVPVGIQAGCPVQPMGRMSTAKNQPTMARKPKPNHKSSGSLRDEPHRSNISSLQAWLNERTGPCPSLEGEVFVSDEAFVATIMHVKEPNDLSFWSKGRFSSTEHGDILTVGSYGCRDSVLKMNGKPVAYDPRHGSLVYRGRSYQQRERRHPPKKAQIKRRNIIAHQLSFMLIHAPGGSEAEHWRLVMKQIKKHKPDFIHLAHVWTDIVPWLSSDPWFSDMYSQFGKEAHARRGRQVLFSRYEHQKTDMRPFHIQLQMNGERLLTSALAYNLARPFRPDDFRRWFAETDAADINDVFLFLALPFGEEDVNNDLIPKEYRDAWKELAPNAVGATWNVAKNPLAAKHFQKGAASGRFDRILYRGNRYRPVEMRLVGNKGSEKPFSGHYGLFARFRLQPNATPGRLRWGTCGLEGKTYVSSEKGQLSYLHFQNRRIFRKRSFLNTPIDANRARSTQANAWLVRSPRNLSLNSRPTDITDLTES